VRLPNEFLDPPLQPVPEIDIHTRARVCLLHHNSCRATRSLANRFPRYRARFQKLFRRLWREAEKMKAGFFLATTFALVGSISTLGSPRMTGWLPREDLNWNKHRKRQTWLFDLQASMSSRRKAAHFHHGLPIFSRLLEGTKIPCRLHNRFDHDQPHSVDNFPRYIYDTSGVSFISA
jgi:hypothetical protein